MQGDGLIRVVAQVSLGDVAAAGLDGDARTDGQAGVGRLAVQLGDVAGKVDGARAADAGVADILQIGVVANAQRCATDQAQAIAEKASAGQRGVGAQHHVIQGAAAPA